MESQAKRFVQRTADIFVRRLAPAHDLEHLEPRGKSEYLETILDFHLFALQFFLKASLFSTNVVNIENTIIAPNLTSFS